MTGREQDTEFDSVLIMYGLSLPNLSSAVFCPCFSGWTWILRAILGRLMRGIKVAPATIHMDMTHLLKFNNLRKLSWKSARLQWDAPNLNDYQPSIAQLEERGTVMVKWHWSQGRWFDPDLKDVNFVSQRFMATMDRFLFSFLEVLGIHGSHGWLPHSTKYLSGCRLGVGLASYLKCE